MKLLTIIILFALFILNSCSQETKSVDKLTTTDKRKHLKKDVTDKELSKIKLFSEVEKKQEYKCDRVLITKYEKTNSYNKNQINYRPFSTEQIIDVKINDFNKLIKKSNKTGYCCCPERDFQILFFDKINNYKKYIVDTTTSTKQIRVFETSYQYSYLIDKLDWDEFLKSQKIIDFREYSIYDFTKSKKAYQYVKTNNLPVITSNTTSEKWMEYEGDFKVSISTVGKKINENEIYKNIYRQYPKENYKIETIGKYQMCDSYDGNDCYEEYVLKIYCSKDFHDIFEAYLPKSFFDKAIGTFIVVGTQNELESMNKLFGEEK
jgi:hypothetical protein